jgi:phenylalanyl-tRNA synthetase beta chain
MFDRAGILSGIEYRSNSDVAALHPGQAATILLDGEPIGMIGVVHPQTQKHFDLNQAYVVAEIALSALLNRELSSFSNLSKFPETTRDLALIVKNEVAAGDILTKIQEKLGKLLKNCDIFDTYRGENIPSGFKSLAFSLSMQSEIESLTSEFIDELINDLLVDLESSYGATLRS